MQEDTPMIVDQKYRKLRQAFFSGKTRDIKYRKDQLKQLKIGLQENEKLIWEAIYKDLKRDHFSTFLQELATWTGEIDFTLKNLDSWIKPEKVDSPLTVAPASSRIIYQPLGAVCVIGAWNFPWFTNIRPLITAIAAGNCVLVKPSEMSPASSAAIRKVVEGYLDNECYQVVEGGAEVSIACSQTKWDLIWFTGSSEKGKLVAQSAAKNLTPCVLELGGKSITVVDETAKINLAAAKILGGRFTNWGQVCIAPDYVMVHESKKQELLDKIVQLLPEMFGTNPQKHENYSRIVNEFHTQRVLDLCKGHGGKIICGGEGDIKDKYVAPTIIVDPKLDSPIMTEEIFGPVLPIVSFKDIDEVYDHLAEREKPLAMYYFGDPNSQNKQILEDHFQSGGMVVNDAIVQAVVYDAGFGGVGNSGNGKYGGRTGFRHFSNSKSVVSKAALDIEMVNKLILPPYSQADQTQIKLLLSLGLYQSTVQKFLLLLIVLFVAFLTYKWAY